MSNPPNTNQEFSIILPNNSKEDNTLIRFISQVDFNSWGQVKISRENNMKQFKHMDEEIPKFGAGSEYGREAREEAKRKKFGIIKKKYNQQDQPWIFKVGDKGGKKIRGTREGGVSQNASYYVFTQAPGGAIIAVRLDEWYFFQPIQRYKALSAEEAEQEFGRRNKLMNYFSLMTQKRLKNEEGEDDEEELKLKKGLKKSTEFKISEMDEWIDSDDDSSSNNEEMEDDDGEKKAKKAKDIKNKKKGALAKSKKQKGSDESALEESDDGDEEGRELDYISDSSEDVSDHDEKAVKEMKGVSEESALRRLLTSDEDEDEDEDKKDEGKEKEEKEKEKAKLAAERKERESKKRKRTNAKTKQKKDKESSSDSSSDSSDSDSNVKTKPKSKAKSRSSSPAEKKIESSITPVAKKPKLEPVMLSYGGENGINEDALRRYLMRKPFTVAELIQKFKNKKTGLKSKQIVNALTQMLKKINPHKQTIKNKMYLSIRPQ